ncbi:sulfotransferase [uncultured Paraglaciecola sp.]|uniref:tetratricopeptide repeat-containing sulfotransferase family protein n=1 Tax=uncultured Paraglaciecola sp. TaxID=1765024 RepID=UPI0030DBDD8E|tara:strand:- start:20088 stop:21626 length:1539 start_codon:yes stop_codon:yes gene_type:complete
MQKQAFSAFTQGDIKTAHSLSVEVISHDPNADESYFLLALINVQIHQYVKAGELFKHAIKINDCIRYRVELAKVYSLQGISDAVIAIVNTIDIHQVKSFSQLNTLGVTLSIVGLHSQALACFERAIDQKPAPETLYNYAVSAKFCGQYKQATKALNQAIALKPGYHQAHFALADLTEGTASQAHIVTLQNLLSSEKLSTEQTMHLSHALAKEFEKQKEYGLAYQTLLQAKQQKKVHSPYQRSADSQLFEGLKAVLEKPVTPSNSNLGNNSERPIFVVGMPRSGTTLVERILSTHSQVTSGGELEDFSLLMKHASQSASHSVLDAKVFSAHNNIDFATLAKAYLTRTAHIGKGQGKFVDKLPFNFFYLPFIRKAFPKARIICLMRNPLDTCVGNFKQLFSINNPHYNYTQSLEDCAWFYQQFEAWVSTWSNQDTQYTHMLHYEELVANPELHIGQLLEFCNLPWEPECLNIQSNTSPVSTASKMQVREPINQKSVGRWTNFRPYTSQIETIFL